MLSSGSLVVIRCIHSPGAEIALVKALSLRPASLIDVYKRQGAASVSSEFSLIYLAKHIQHFVLAFCMLCV